jgi:hypothetical protein
MAQPPQAVAGRQRAAARVHFRGRDVACRSFAEPFATECRPDPSAGGDHGVLRRPRPAVRVAAAVRSLGGRCELANSEFRMWNSELRLAVHEFRIQNSRFRIPMMWRAVVQAFRRVATPLVWYSRSPSRCRSLTARRTRARPFWSTRWSYWSFLRSWSCS